MARYKIPYPGLNESLKHLRTQVIHSLPYTVKNLPRFSTPEEIFKYCKSKYTFRNDPPGTELFQTVPTLLQNNDIGNPGHGDCDDATIFCLAELLNSGFTDIGIVLTGRNKTNASHIYVYVIDNGQRKILDLTNKNFNQERPYPFKQYIPFKISKNQLDMFLQLADSPQRQLRRKKPRLRILTEKQKQEAVYLPSKNVFIPLDKFDKQPIKKARTTLLSEGYDLEQLSEYLSGRAERKARKAQRAEKKKEKYEFKKAKRQAKIEKKQAKTEIKKARAEKKRSAGEAKKMRAEAKIIKSERQDPGRFKDIFKGGAEVAKSFFNREEEEPEEETEDTTAIDVTDQEEEQTPYQEEETDETTELEEGNLLNNQDLLYMGLFVTGFILEKTKKVA